MDWITSLGQVTWYGVRNGVVYILFASGLSLVFGVMRVVNFAHGELYMLGAMLVYTFATLLGLNFFLSVALSIALVAVAGLLVNRVAVQPILKVKGAAMGVLLSTAALSFILLHGGVAAWGSWVVPINYPVSGAFHIGGVAIEKEGLLLVVVGAVAIGGLHLFLAKARLGKEMRATSQDVRGASLVGIRVLRVYDYTMAAGAMLAGLGAILLAQVTSAFVGMGQPMLVLGFAIVILGGMGNIRGVAIIGLAIGIAEALLGYYVSLSYKLAFVYALMIAGLLWRPEGVFPRR